MSGKELNMEKQNQIIRLRKLIENGDIIMPDPEICRELMEDLRQMEVI